MSELQDSRCKLYALTMDGGVGRMEMSVTQIEETWCQAGAVKNMPNSPDTRTCYTGLSRPTEVQPRPRGDPRLRQLTGPKRLEPKRAVREEHNNLRWEKPVGRADIKSLAIVTLIKCKECSITQIAAITTKENTTRQQARKTARSQRYMLC